MPKRVKFRKSQRGRMAGKAKRGSTIAFGDFGLKAAFAPDQPGEKGNGKVLGLGRRLDQGADRDRRGLFCRRGRRAFLRRDRRAEGEKDGGGHDGRSYRHARPLMDPLRPSPIFATRICRTPLALPFQRGTCIGPSNFPLGDAQRLPNRVGSRGEELWLRGFRRGQVFIRLMG